MMLKTSFLLLKVILVVMFKTQVPKCNCLIIFFVMQPSRWGILPRFILSDFSQILAFDSGRKTSCLLQKFKFMYKNIVVLFYKQN